MEKIKILTSQNVSIEYTLALAGERIISNLIDLLIKAGYAIIVNLVLSIVNLDNNILSTIFILLPIMLYHPVSEIYLNGQTIGMKFQNTKVISIDGRELSVGSILLRSILRVVDISLSMGAVALFSIIATEKGQRLGDIAAGTTVVKILDEMSFKEIQFKPIDENYKVQFEQVRDLNDQEIQLIKEAVSLYIKTRNRDLVDVAATKVKVKLGIESSLTSHKFLDIIIRDHNFLIGRM